MLHNYKHFKPSRGPKGLLQDCACSWLLSCFSCFSISLFFFTSRQTLESQRDPAFQNYTFLFKFNFKRASKQSYKGGSPESLEKSSIPSLLSDLQCYTIIDISNLQGALKDFYNSLPTTAFFLKGSCISKLHFLIQI